jgi:hypothetical protein
MAASPNPDMEFRREVRETPRALILSLERRAGAVLDFFTSRCTFLACCPILMIAFITSSCDTVMNAPARRRKLSRLGDLAELSVYRSPSPQSKTTGTLGLTEGFREMNMD